MRWRVTAWVQAPGDFPTLTKKSVVVPADTITHAIARAENTIQFQINPVVVSAVRITPPPGQEHP